MTVTVARPVLNDASEETMTTPDLNGFMRS